MPLRLVRPLGQFRQPSNLLSRTTIRLLGAYAIAQGIGVVQGGPERWRGSAYAVLRQVPAATEVWGWTAILFGSAILVGSLSRTYWLKTFGLVGLSCWSLSLAAGFLASAFAEATVGTTGGPAHLAIGLLAVPVVFVDERKDRTGWTSALGSGPTSEA